MKNFRLLVSNTFLIYVVFFAGDLAAAVQICQDLSINSNAHSTSWLSSLASFLEQAVLQKNFLIAGSMSLAAGFLTALSPCVYPLIPITLSIMGSRKYESRMHGFFTAAIYVLGMITLYSALGISFASLGILAGSLLQNQFVLVGIALFFIVLALGMLGVFNILLPQKFLARLTKIGGSSYKGVFLMGLVSGIIAAPCTGPVLAFILTLVAVGGEVFTGAYLTILYGLGMGLPFLVLGTFSSAITHIPKSGSFMNVVKIIFAVAMFAAAFYYMQLAFPLSQSEKKIELNWTTIAGQDSMMKFEQALAEARKNCQPVLIDFYANWCAACKELESTTFKDTKVQQALQKFKLIKIDATSATPVVEEIQKRYAIFGLPSIIFIQPSGKVIDELRIDEYIEAKEFYHLLPKLEE